MLKSFLKLFEDTRSQKGAAYTVELATAALLFEIVNADKHVTQSEREEYERQLKRHANVDPEALSLLLEQGQETADDAIDLVKFTQVLNAQYDAEEKRLTGIMLAETSRFYTDKLLRAQANLNAKGNDEHFLYRIVKEAGFGIPPRNSTARDPDTNALLVKYRPDHGIHLSFNRGPGARMCLPSQNLFFEGMLKFDGLDEFLHHDLFANDYFDTIKAKFEEQAREDMIVFNHICQPRRNTLNQTLTHRSIEPSVDRKPVYSGPYILKPLFERFHQ